MDYSPPESSFHGIIQARILGVGCHSFSNDLPDPGIKSVSPALQANSLSLEPPGKPSCNLETEIKSAGLLGEVLFYILQLGCLPKFRKYH